MEVSNYGHGCALVRAEKVLFLPDTLEPGFAPEVKTRTVAGQAYAVTKSVLQQDGVL